jgi:Cytochrome c554 and c-prime
MSLEKPQEERPSGGWRSQVRWCGYLVLGAVFAAGVAIGLWRSGLLAFRGGASLSRAKASVDPSYALYVGDRVCSECHPGEVALHSRSGHSRTLRPAGGFAWTRELDGLTTEDPERPGVIWKYVKRDGKLWTERAENGTVERFLIDYAFGSGRHATTFVTMFDRDPRRPICREQRMTLFAHSGSPGVGVTPGLSLAGHAVGNSDRGRVNSVADTLNCFRCHTTVISDRGDDVLDEATMIPNISCESCHGPARSHIEAARRGADGSTLRMPFGPGRWTTNEQLQFCGSCHRLPAMISPGAIRIDNPTLVRHQPVGMVQSACFKQSNRALNCVTCHDPHSRVSSDRASYERVCLSCHGANTGTSCGVSPLSGCIDCHMPRRDVTRGMMMTDHWIRIIPGSRLQRPSAAARQSPTTNP